MINEMPDEYGREYEETAEPMSAYDVWPLVAKVLGIEVSQARMVMVTFDFETDTVGFALEQILPEKQDTEEDDDTWNFL